MWKLLPYIKTSPERDIKSAAAKHCELTTNNKKNSFMYPGIHCHKRPYIYIYISRADCATIPIKMLQKVY
jgi:hypothetical protein